MHGPMGKKIERGMGGSPESGLMVDFSPLD